MILAGINAKLVNLKTLKERVESAGKFQQVIAAQYDDILKQVSQRENKVADTQKLLENVETFERRDICS